MVSRKGACDRLMSTLWIACIIVGVYVAPGSTYVVLSSCYLSKLLAHKMSLICTSSGHIAIPRGLNNDPPVSNEGGGGGKEGVLLTESCDHIAVPRRAKQ
ncbi:unnamed protein product [Pylaiella littoralis]